VGQEFFLLPNDPSRKQSLHQRLAARHPDFAKLAIELYRALILPAGRELLSGKTVCIIPDKFLWNLH